MKPTLRALALLALALFALPSFALAAQGQGVGTLPTATRDVGWLTAHQTITLTHGEVVFIIGSTHDAEEDTMPPTPPQTAEQVLRHSWKWHGVDVVVETPRLGNEGGPAGEERWEQRHATAVERALNKWPRDA